MQCVSRGAATPSKAKLAKKAKLSPLPDMSGSTTPKVKPVQEVYLPPMPDMSYSLPANDRPLPPVAEQSYSMPTYNMFRRMSSLKLNPSDSLAALMANMFDLEPFPIPIDFEPFPIDLPGSFENQLV
jgi:hypothetical protein